MKTNFFLLAIGVFLFFECAYSQNDQSTHRDPTHNFTMQRLLILNDKGEMLMCKEDYVWAPPSGMYSQRQYVKEGLDSIAQAYGIKIAAPNLHGYFSYKYDYHPYATLRSYYVADYVSGELKLPSGMDDVKWMPIAEAVAKTTVTSIKQSIQQILEFPDTLWGGSFMVSREKKGHPTKQIEAFYPLFNAKE